MSQRKHWRVPVVVSLLALAGGCADENVVRQTIGVARTRDTSKGALSVAVLLKDGGPQGLTGWRLVLNGRPVVYEGDPPEYAVISSQGDTVIYAPAGRYALTLEDAAGDVIAAAGIVQIFEQDEANVLFYGDRSDLRSFVVNPSLPRFDGGGNYILRILNVMAGGETIDVVKDCDLAVFPPACTTVRAALPYGERFELPVPEQSATSYGIRYASCTENAPCVMPYRKTLAESPDGQLPLANVFPGRYAVQIYPLSL